MRSIERFIRDELATFLSLNHRAYFEDDHSGIVRLLRAEQWIEGDTWKPAMEVFNDFAIVDGLGAVADELGDWLREVDEVRTQWFYDHIEVVLPTDYLSAFGHTAPLVQSLEPMLNRCRRIVRRIDELHAAKPKAVDNWPSALACLTGQEIALVEAMRESAAGLSYAEMIEVEGAFDDIAIPSNARTRVMRIRNSWKEHGIPFAIPTPRRGGKLKVVKTISEKNVSDT